MSKDYNPFKKILLYLTIGIVFIALALVLIFINWIMNHIYTVAWFFCVIGCVIWLVYSLIPTNDFPNNEDLKETFD